VSPVAMLDDVKVALRVSHTALDGEISDLIAAARQDLILSGVSAAKANSSTDALIKRAVTTYVKAHFGYDNPDADRLLMAYDRLKAHLTLAGDYT
jgi:uncharacterized phage protein (predicted DNA packaging)